MTEGYDYTALVDNAMRSVVRDVLLQVQQHGLVDPHHFFVTFRTSHKGVVMSDTLRSKYPGEITIVLQHQFRELKVEQDCFRVVLSFNNIPEKLVIPYAALTGFADPSVKFGLQFHASEDDSFVRAAAAVAPQEEKAAPAAESQSDEDKESKIITLDAFRKK